MLTALEPAERSKEFAEMALAEILDARAINRRALGAEPLYTTYVDGNANAALESVKPNGVIFVEFQLITEVLAFIGQQLEMFSPVKTGRYKRSHVLLADGIAMELDTPAMLAQLAIAEEYVFVNTVPYARKIERGMSPQAPDGVYQAVANIARTRYSKIARITFSYRTIVGGLMIGGREGDRSEKRNPAVIVRIGK